MKVPPTLELMLTFDEPDVVAIEQAVAAYQRGHITGKEMAERVMETARQYDAISQGFAYSEIEDVIGDEVPEFWRRPRRRRRRSAQTAEEDW